MIMDRQSSEFNDSNRSLRRSFVAIHGKSSPIIMDDDGRRCYNRKDSSSSLPKSNKGSRSSLHQHKKSRGSNRGGGNRRTSMDTASPSPLCPPPNPQHIHSSRKPQQQMTLRLRRRSTYTGMTADEAQKRVAEMLNDKLTIKQQQQEEPTQRRRMVLSSSNHKLKQHEHSLHTSMPNLHQQTNDQQQQPTRQLGYRPDYQLGQTVRSTSHIKIPTSSQNAMQQVSTLMKYDFAFIKRSNGLYSYAILAYRSNNDKKGESLTFVMDDKGCTKMIRKKYWCEYIRLVNTDDLELEQQEQHGDNMMRLSKEGLYNPPPSYKRRVSDPHQVTTTDDMHQFSKYKSEDVDMLCQEIPIVCQEVPQDDAVDEYYTQEDEDDDETAPLPDMIAFKPTNGNDECSLISSVSDRARRAYSAARVWRSGGGD